MFDNEYRMIKKKYLGRYLPDGVNGVVVAYLKTIHLNNFKNHYIDRSNYSRKSYLNAEYDDKNWEEYDNARDWHYYD